MVALDPQNLAHENGAEKSTSATLLPAVLSIGYNPFYKNTVRSVVRIPACLCRQLNLYLRGILAHFTFSGNPHHAPSHTALPNSRRATQIQPPARFLRHPAQPPDLGYIRPEYDYVSLEALIEDIRIDCEVARQSLLREAYQRYIVDDGKASAQVTEDRKWLATFEGVNAKN